MARADGFLAVGLVGTKLRRLSRTRLAQVSTDPEWAALLAAARGYMAFALSAGVTKDITPRPKTDVHLSDEGEILVKKGQKMHAKKRHHLGGDPRRRRTVHRHAGAVF